MALMSDKVSFQINAMSEGLRSYTDCEALVISQNTYGEKNNVNNVYQGMNLNMELDIATL